MSTLPSLLDMAKQAMTDALRLPEDERLAVDATLGNGKDTLFLAHAVGPHGLVHGFDIQPTAVERTRARLTEAGLADRAVLHLAGHELLGELLPPEWRRRVAAASFNLGWLPGAERTIITRPDTTLTALEALTPFLRPGGVIALVAYLGHPGGSDEAMAVDALAARLVPAEWRCLRVAQTNAAPGGCVLHLWEKGEK